jgi:hypothetical protein
MAMGDPLPISSLHSRRHLPMRILELKPRLFCMIDAKDIRLQLPLPLGTLSQSVAELPRKTASG